MKATSQQDAEFRSWVASNPNCVRTLNRIKQFLFLKWVRVVHDMFGSDVEAFYSRFKHLAIQAKKARSNSLTDKEAWKFKSMSKQLNDALAFTRSDEYKLNKAFRYNGKSTRLPIRIIVEAMSDTMTFIPHGGGYYSSSQMPPAFARKFVPHKDKAKMIYEHYVKQVYADENQSAVSQEGGEPL